ncbi:MAG: 16S rRNA (cytosine(967)-C(5))-methyltransferase RsmB [Firmicutes bacterium]|nr:16S rRNA (cytosine(967)-C(5))-methyltransferase RsmB [Bacillota bacterium]
MKDARKTAYTALLAIEKHGSFSDLELKRLLTGGEEGEAFVRELVYGVTERKIWLDYELSHFVKRGLHAVKREALVLLRIGAYQLEFMTAVPDYAAISETVELAKKVLPGLSGFVNGVLRAFARGRASIRPNRETLGEKEWLSLTCSCGEALTELLLAQYGSARTEEFLRFALTPAPAEIRVNLLREDAASLPRELASQGFSLTESTVSPRSFAVSGSGLIRTDAYREGRFAIQSAASCAIADLAAPEPGSFVIDTCAAPGGKTMAMAEAMGGKGRVLAMDVSQTRLAFIGKEAKRLGVRNVETLCWDGREEAPELVGKADLVLTDVPCSGLGVIRRKPEIKYRDFAPGLPELLETQRKILASAIRYVRPGGRLCYSTCTINRQENEEQIRVLLKECTDLELLMEKQFWPGTDQTDGFYAALIRKNDREKGALDGRRL